IGNGRHDAGVEEALLPRRDLGRDLTLVRGLVRQHRLTDDVADREDVRNVRALLLVDRDQATLADLDAGALERELATVRAATDGHEHPAVNLRRSRRLVALE